MPPPSSSSKNWHRPINISITWKIQTKIIDWRLRNEKEKKTMGRIRKIYILLHRNVSDCELPEHSWIFAPFGCTVSFHQLDVFRPPVVFLLLFFFFSFSVYDAVCAWISHFAAFCESFRFLTCTWNWLVTNLCRVVWLVNGAYPSTLIRTHRQNCNGT